MNMSARAIATAEAVSAAAEELLAAGIRPTLARLREKIGGGSMSTIQSHLTAWKEARDKKLTSESQAVLPRSAIVDQALADVRGHLEDAFDRLLQPLLAHEDQLKSRFEAERAELAEDIVDIRRELSNSEAREAAAHEKILLLQQEVEERRNSEKAAQGLLLKAGQTTAAAEARTAEAMAALHNAKVELTGLQASLDEMKNAHHLEVMSLHAEISEWQAQYAEASKLKEIREADADRLRQELSSLNEALAGVNRTLDEKNEELGKLAERLAASQRSVASAAAKNSELELVISEIRISASSLQGRLDASEARGIETETRLERLNGEIRALAGDLRAAEQRSENLSAENNRLEKLSENLQGKLDASAAAEDICRKELEGALRQIAEQERSANTLLDRLNAAERKLDEIKHQKGERRRSSRGVRPRSR